MTLLKCNIAIKNNSNTTTTFVRTTIAKITKINNPKIQILGLRLHTAKILVENVSRNSEEWKSHLEDTKNEMWNITHNDIQDILRSDLK